MKVRVGIAVVLLGLSLPVAAWAQEEEGQAWQSQTPLSGMQWEERPTDESFARYFPLATMRAGLSGRAVLDCLVLPERTLNCEIESEEPEGAGFGEAARQISQEFVAAATTADGAPTVGGRVRLPIRFVNEPGPSEPEIITLPPGADLFWEMGLIAHYYPEAARAAGVTGRVALDCTINQSLRYDCSVVSEDPAGWGFGQAALAMLSEFFFQQGPDEPTLVGRRQLIPIHFREQR